ncbi:MAG: hypothetical protein JXA37_08780 [Chloroflexia bacterium]|nr:hypothetical protein [Chloroflexia bacterium]
MGTHREPKPPDYRSYLLRLWPTRSHEEEVWRASLEQAGSGQMSGFASLQALFDYLLAETEQAEKPKDPDRERR